MPPPAKVKHKVINLPNFRGGPLAFLKNHDHEVILSGGSDIGKTWAGCVKSFLLCSDKNRSNIHGCMVRKTYNSIEESCARTFKSITAGMPIRRLGGATHTEKWIFQNKSELVTVGMDKPDKLLSSEWDFIQVVQAEQLTQNDWEIIASRCTGRGATVAYPQIFGDCNPGGSKHWIRDRAAKGTLTLINSTHRDNPSLYDDLGNILAEGTKRIGLLEATLTGVRRARLLEGKWATAEGAVYDQFNATVHVRVRYREEMKRFFLTLDEGFTNPAVVLDVGEDSDGRQHIFREFYETGVVPEDHVEAAVTWWNEPTKGEDGIVLAVPRYRYELAAVDESAAGLIASLKKRGVRALGGKGGVLDGIRLVSDLVKVQKGDVTPEWPDGRPRLTVDPSCVQTINEFESYTWKPEKDVPKKEFDHAMDALRYLQDVLAVPTGALTPQTASGLATGQTAAGRSWGQPRTWGGR